MKTLRNSALLAAALFGATAVQAADPIVIEAEDYAYAYNMDEVEVAEGATEPSGSMMGSTQGAKGTYQEVISGEGGSYAQYSFEVPEEGTYDLTIYYASMFDRWLRVTINNQMSTMVYCDELSGAWYGETREVEDEDGNITVLPGIVNKTIKVYCEKGENELQINAAFGPSNGEGRDVPFTPNLDRFVLTRSSEEIAKPIDWDNYLTIVRQMETADSRSGSATIDERANFDGGMGACIGGGGGALVYNVEVEQAGVYNLSLWYGLFENRWCKIKVNSGEPYYVQQNQWADGSWDTANTFRNQLVYLEKGMNTITFSNFTKVGANASSNADTAPMDLFTLDLVSYPDFVIPENEIAAPRYALSNIATWKSSNLDNVNKLTDHNEWTVATAASSTADVTLEFPYNILLTGYSWASTADDKDGWTVEVSADGQSWHEAPAAISMGSVGQIYSANLGNPFETPDPVKYVRLNITGAANATIGDFAVFGYPYLDEACHNPAGLFDTEIEMEGLFTSEVEGFYNVTDEGVIEDETTHRIFDGNNSTFWTPVCNSETPSVTIEFYLDEEVEVASYLIATPYRANWSGRNPQYWTLAAYDYDNDDYLTLDEKNGVAWNAIGGAYIFPVEDAVPSDYYKFTLRETKSKTLHLSGLQLYTENLSGMAGVNNIAASVAAKIAFSVVNRTINFNAAAGTAYGVYTISGSTVATGKTAANGSAVSLQPGIYVVKVGNVVKKIVIR